jgi:hypothetical protein
MAPTPEAAAQAASRTAARAGARAEQSASSFSRWVEQHRLLAISLGLGTLAVGGAAGYYFFAGPRTRGGAPPPASGTSSPRLSSEKAAAGGEKKKKKKSKGGKKSAAADAGSLPAREDGPLLEEATDGEQADAAHSHMPLTMRQQRSSSCSLRTPSVAFRRTAARTWRKN